MNDSTYDEDGVRISCSEVVCSHYRVSPSLKMASLTGRELLAERMNAQHPEGPLEWLR